VKSIPPSLVERRCVALGLQEGDEAHGEVAGGLPSGRISSFSIDMRAMVNLDPSRNWAFLMQISDA
jgi:hypothetical protein